MATYVWCKETNHWVDKKTRERMHVPDRGGEISVPMVVSDIPEYRSPVDGKLISSRSTRREDMKKNDCVPWEPISNRPRGIPNERIAKKYGLKVNEAAQHRERAKRINPLAGLK